MISIFNNLHIVSLNSNGLRDYSKRVRLNEWIKQQKADIIYLQETHFTADIIVNVNQQFSDWNVYHSFGSSYSCGCSILISNSIQFKSIKHISHQNGRYIILNSIINDNTFTFLNIYAPNIKRIRNEFF